MTEGFKRIPSECPHERLTSVEDTTHADDNPHHQIWCALCGEDQLALPSFLRARLEEDRLQALERGHEALRYGVDNVTDRTLSDRVLREVETKRLILDEYLDFLAVADPIDDRTDQRVTLRFALEALAGVYDGHADYRASWSIVEVST
jgi:hypothetical protein